MSRLADGALRWQHHETASGSFVGLLSLRNLKSATPEFGLWITESHQHKGFAKEAMPALIDWAWKHTAAEALVYETEKENIASIALAESLNMSPTAESATKYILERPS